MTRTYGHKGKRDADKREDACHWVDGWDYVVFGHNVTKYHFIQNRHHHCTQAEVSKMCERLDARAMDKEWTRMQIEAEQNTE